MDRAEFVTLIVQVSEVLDWHHEESQALELREEGLQS